MKDDVEDLSDTRNCVECASDIPAVAIKCTKCGSYQNWRRHIAFGQAGFALILSLIAISSAIWANTGLIFENFFSAEGKRNFAIQIGIVEINQSKASVIVKNFHRNAIALNHFSCRIYLPTDTDIAEGNYTPPKWPLKKEAIGMFLFSYTVPDHSVLNTGQTASLTFIRKHITPPRSDLLKPEDEAMSSCLVTGVDQDNELSANFMFLRPFDLLGFKLTEVLRQADFSEAQANERSHLIRLIEERKGGADN